MAMTEKDLEKETNLKNLVNFFKMRGPWYNSFKTLRETKKQTMVMS